MKNPVVTLILVSTIIITIVGVVAYKTSQNTSQSDSVMKKDEIVMLKEDSTKESTKMIDADVTSSRYVQYSKQDLDSASSNRRVLFFYASWCPTCRPADESFTQNENKIPSDVKIIRVNYNDPDTDQEEKDLARKYGVTYQHTFVQIDEAGNEVTKWNGGKLDELLSKVK